MFSGRGGRFSVNSESVMRTNLSGSDLSDLDRTEDGIYGRNAATGGRRGEYDHVQHPITVAERITIYVALVVFVWMSLLMILLTDNSGLVPVFPSLLPRFQRIIVPVYSGLLQALTFGWLYAGVVMIWERAGIPYISCFRVPARSTGDPMGQFPFLTGFLGNSNLAVAGGGSTRLSRAHSTSVGSPYSPKSPTGASSVNGAAHLHPAAARDQDEGPHTARRVALLASHLTLALAVSLLGYIAFVHFDMGGAAPQPRSGAGGEAVADDDNQTPVGSRLFPGSLFALAAMVFAAAFICLPLPRRWVPYAWTRLSLGAILGQVLTAPLFGVEFVHIVVADAWTSASLTLWNIEESVCLFATGAFLRPSISDADWCSSESGWHYRIMQPIMYGLPFWIRFLQCWYKFFTTRHLGCSDWNHMSHLVNAGKYFSAIMVVVSSSLHRELHPHDPSAWNPSRWFWFAALIVKTVYCYVWDLRMDWDIGHLRCNVRRRQQAAKLRHRVTDGGGNFGSISSNSARTFNGISNSSSTRRLFAKSDSSALLSKDGARDDEDSDDERTSLLNSSDHLLLNAPSPESKPFPFLLRPTRVYSRRWVYYFAMVTNFLARCSWSIALSARVGLLPKGWGPLMALVEILRRAQWKVFRMENEYLHKKSQL